MDTETEKATATAEADTSAADELSAASEGQADAEKTGAETDQPTLEQLQEQIKALSGQVEEAQGRAQAVMTEAGQEADRRVTAAHQKWERDAEIKDHRSKVKTLVQRVRDGDTDVLGDLESAALEAIDRPYRDQATAAAATGAKNLGVQDGLAAAFGYRIDRLQPTQAVMGEYLGLFRQGRYADLDQKLVEAERQAKPEGGKPQGAEKASVAEARKGKGPDSRPSGAGGRGDSYRTKAEARILHVQNKISNAEMKAVNADLTIPEG